MFIFHLLSYHQLELEPLRSSEKKDGKQADTVCIVARGIVRIQKKYRKYYTGSPSFTGSMVSGAGRGTKCHENSFEAAVVQVSR
jgi:hypothetical protein